LGPYLLLLLLQPQLLLLLLRYPMARARRHVHYRHSCRRYAPRCVDCICRDPTTCCCCCAIIWCGTWVLTCCCCCCSHNCCCCCCGIRWPGPNASAGLVFAVGFDVIPIPVLVAAAVALLTSEAAAAATAAHAHVVAAVAGTARSHLLRINMRHNHLLSYLLGRELTLLLMPLLMLELFLRLFMVDWRRLLLWLNSWTSCSCCCHSVSRRRTLTCHGVTQTLRKNLADAGPNHLGIHISFGGGVS